jgi:carbonic anhydrase
VPPEIIFDQGLGDLFVVRVAGNVAADVEVGSLEYGAEHLHIPLLVVLGHEQCGAVTAALQGGPPEGHISALVNLIKPAVEKSRGLKGDPVSNAVRTNVEMVVKELRSSTPLLSELVAQHKLKIVGAVYSLETGKVTWLPENN